ncbi:MAG: hypothetical protein ABII12_18330 [Planctomycetota bacterium]
MKRIPLRSLSRVVVVTALAAVCLGATCIQVFFPCDDATTVTIRLINDSETQTVAPNLGLCPNGMANQPHYFVSTPPVLAPGEETTYTGCQIAGCGGNCETYSTDFMVGLCGWQYGPSADDLTATENRFGGQIGMQFNCGDTITLRWCDEGAAGGTWTSEVQTAPGNAAPTADFQNL